MPKSPRELLWIEDLLPTENTLRKPMFGGWAYYVQDKLALVLFENHNDREYQGIEYPFEIWNGAMFPLEKEHHPKIVNIFPFLFPHPVLPKWLYLPQDSENFEEHTTELIRHVLKNLNIWGTISEKRKKKGIVSKVNATTSLKSTTSSVSNYKTTQQEKNKTETIDLKLDTRKPKMFSDENPEEIFKTSKKISDLKNLGLSAEKEFLKIGIMSPTKFKKLGWKKTIKKLSDLNPKNCHSMYAYALIGALENIEWSQISNESKKEAQEFCAELRKKLKKYS